ncbi:metallophosphoesterase [Proteiniphilum sp. X52]|uniref:metallophosphoesterase n=1 Tax=Proteiniphilum sp. X52 TaxID=2382159 RepID=UPI000F0A4378|nr:metallophosphoesterase [Proteiniphilum sp. X52]RNC66090.1 serine/threonine protein phosphatase [Proteiniphilum sp. X52]
MRKKSLLLLLFVSVLCFTLSAQQNDYTKPSLSDGDSWSLILLPDVQTYVKFDYNQPILDLMLAWVVNNMQVLNTKMVLCPGDLVEQNDLFNPNGRVVNQTSVSQWEAVSAAFGRLDGQLPYILAIGNHDYGIVNAENRHTHFDKYFPPNKNRLNQKMLREVGMNVEGRPTLANATYEFVSPHGRKFLILVLEFAPRDEALEWAKGVIEKEQYADHTVILLTHSYMDRNNKHIVHENYKIPGPNYGEAVWQKLVKPSKNIRMVFAGHIGVPDDPKGHTAFRVDENAGGKKVSQMVFNAQALGGGWHGNGGDGWLRILEFLPDGKTIKVKTFSPLFAISPTTQKYAWRTEAHDEFTFELD